MAGNTINQDGIIWPSRRKFLRQAPLTLAAFGLLPGIARAKTRAELANVAGISPAQPPVAATWGYDTPIFWDDFASYETIDMGNTLQPGFNWYRSYNQGTRGGSTGTNVLPASAINISNSVLTLNTPYQNPVNSYCLTTMGAIGVSPNVTLVGNNVSPRGCYIEARVAIPQVPEPPLDVGFSNGSPAFWWFDNGITLALANGTSFPAGGFVELDFFEAPSNGKTSILTMTDWHWYSAISSQSNSNTSPNSGAVQDDFQFHTYGCLWVPQSKNGGTGLVNRYIDGVYQSNCSVSYSATTGNPTGWLSTLDSNTLGYGIQIAGAQQWNIYFDYVMLWA